jgi:LysR family glycine cleavage system transcriptional activator
MPRQLPSLNAVRAFEAAARHLSFRRAADELHVTHAAISHQVKGLETFLQTPLFRRLNRAVRLTDAGQAYLPPLRDALDGIAKATARVRGGESGGALTISTSPPFAAKWLVPRLSAFREAHPEIDVWLTPSLHAVDFAREAVDAAVRWGAGEWPGLRADLLGTMEVFPVCSPRLLQGPRRLRTPEDLRHHPLIHDASGEDWQRWLAAAGVSVIPTPALHFHDSSLVIQAAIEAQGVALAYSALVADDLAAGRLVRPFEISLPTEYCYYFVCPHAVAETPKIVAFRTWLLNTVRHQAEREVTGPMLAPEVDG